MDEACRRGQSAEQARMGEPEMVEAMRYVQQTLVDALREQRERHD